MYRGDYESAVSHLVAQRVLAPSDASVALALGVSYVKLRRFQEAVAVLTPLLAAAGSSHNDPREQRLVSLQLGEAHRGTGDRLAAERAFRRGGLSESEARDRASRPDQR